MASSPVLFKLNHIGISKNDIVDRKNGENFVRNSIPIYLKSSNHQSKSTQEHMYVSHQNIKNHTFRRHTSDNVQKYKNLTRYELSTPD